jgi:hypothetical protein
VAYEAYKVAPVLIAQYEFKDSLNEAAKFSRGKKDYQIKDNLAKKAAELGLPIASNQIKVTLQNTSTRIQVQYQLSVEWLPGKLYTWDVDEVAESQIF